MSTVSECIKPRYEKERNYGVIASINIIQGIMDNLMILAMIEDLKKEIRGVRELLLELIQKYEEKEDD